MSEIGAVLTQWLNKTKGTVSPARERVCGLLTALHDLEPLLREHPIVEVPERGPSVFLHSSPGALLREAINKQLANYQFTPTLLVTDADKTTVAWLSSDSREIEATMVRLVCDVYNEGKLSRLRECLCGKWFIARSDNQECCSTGCRQKKWGKTDRGKAAGKKASKDSYNNTDRQPNLKRVKRAIEQWKLKSARFRKTSDWKEWAVGATGINKVFVTRAVNKGDIAPPA
jgi:hypothetical protein